MPAERVTLQAIATAAGVSVSTASRVLRGAPGISDARRRDVLVHADKLGWAGERARPCVTVLSSIDTDAADAPDFQTQLLDGITRTARDLNVAVRVRLLDPQSGLPPDLLSGTDRTGRHGILLLSLDQPALTEEILACDIPVVIANGMDLTGRVSSASAANRSGGYIACRHLLDLGHRHILRLTHDRRLPVRDRFLGADLALAQAGLTPDRSYEIALEDMRSGDAFRAALAALSTHPEITAVQCCNDAAALGVIAAANALGRQVPQDLSVIGFDDIPAAQMSAPALSTIRVPRHEIGAEAVRRLLRVMRAPDSTPVNAEISGTLQVRGSTTLVRRTTPHAALTT